MYKKFRTKLTQQYCHIVLHLYKVKVQGVRREAIWSTNHRAHTRMSKLGGIVPPY